FTVEKLLIFQEDGAAGGIRTPDPNVRSVVLYPTELRPRILRGRDLTTSLFSYKLEPACEQHFAAAHHPVGPEAPQRQNQGADPRRHASGQVRRNRRHGWHLLQSKTESDEHATQQIKEIPCAARSRVVRHSSTKQTVVAGY